ncbi:ABC transporter substrate-binding protein [Jiangella alba]|uniref:Iron complex transport system substrate-binding protein n=1 Tax=Jiangella alba TaxID=561176 RepID=A0A1H5D3Z8_9ACTN|nr:ABC transporter substrate-binding protein [Jiangella alba]SED73572.1 iron complex transport system substrate-binding protein [Jiangella alba]
MNRTLAALAALVALTACGGTDPEPASGAGRSITVDGATGEVTVPVTDSGIWALDEVTGLHLLALGVVPDAVARNPYDGDAYTEAARTILRDAGVEIVEPSNAELVAAAAPELIIGVNFPDHVELLPELEQIAPVLLTDDTRPWDEGLATIAAVTGHDAEAEEVTGRLREAVDETVTLVADAGRTGDTLSVLSACGDQVCLYGSGRTVGRVLAELGFARPPGQDDAGNAWGFTLVSPETLGGHRADIVVELSGIVTRGGDPVLEHPLLDTSGALTATADFAAWFGSDALALTWILHDVAAILAGQPTATRDDAGELWAEVVRT